MTELELNAQAANQAYSQLMRRLIEDRVLVSQWCTSLVQHYNNTTDDVRAKLPPLPGTTPETMLPSLFVEDVSKLDMELYNKEASVLVNIQQEMNRLHLLLNQEAEKCLSESMLQN